MRTNGTLYLLEGNIRCFYFNYYILSRIKHFPLIHGRKMKNRYNVAEYTYTKPPECVHIIRHTSQGFHSWCPGSMSL